MRSANAVWSSIRPGRFPVSRAPRRLGYPAIFALLAIAGCQRSTAPSAIPNPSSAISIDARSDSISIKTLTAEFQILPSGYLRGYLIRNQHKLTIDDPQATDPTDPDYLVIDGKELRDFTMDLAHPRISVPSHRLGALGKRIEIQGISRSQPAIHKTRSEERRVGKEW